VVEIPVFARTAKLPAVPRYIGVGPAAMAEDTIMLANIMTRIDT